MFRSSSSRTRGPIVGIIIATIFITFAFTLIQRWNQVGTEAAETNNGPTVVDSIQEWEEYTTLVEGRNIQIRALKDERVQILRVAQPVPQPEAKEEVITDPTEAPPPQEEPVQAPDNTNMGSDAQTSPDQAPATATPIPVVTAAPVVVVVSTQPPVAYDPNSPLIAYRSHTVQAGETLFRLTRIYSGTNLDMLARYGITEADMIAGNVIQVPYANGAACQTGRACPIAKGDTLYSLSRAHNTTVLHLQQLNGIGQDFAITAGEAICVP